MSREAMEAAQDHSGLDDPFGLHILVTIGRFVAHDTKQGWCSDRTIADIAKVDKDSIGRWRERFVAAGIAETWTTGAGRGTKRWYRFLMPFKDPIYNGVIGDNPPETSPQEGDNNDGDIKLLLSRVDRLLSLFEKLLSPDGKLLSLDNVPIVPIGKGQEHPNTLEAPLGSPQPPQEEPESLPSQPEPAGSSGGCSGDFAAVVKAYENNIGGITSKVSELIGDAVDTYPHDWIIDAIGIAVRNNSLKWNYVEGVLKKWQVHGRGYSPKTNGRNGHHPNQVPAPSQGLVEITPGSGRY